jgi:hypothetical protein
MAAATAQTVPLSDLIEHEREKIVDATKLFQKECARTSGQHCAEERAALLKALKGFIGMAKNELATLPADQKSNDPELDKETARRDRMHSYIQWAREQMQRF